MKIVLDTNVLFAALASHGACFELLEYCVSFHQLYTSPLILAELHKHLIEKLDLSPKKASQVTKLLSSRMEAVDPKLLPRRVCRDPDDDAILGTALSAKCQCLITGDKDLLVLRSHEGIDIISPAGFWKYEASLQ